MDAYPQGKLVAKDNGGEDDGEDLARGHDDGKDQGAVLLDCLVDEELAHRRADGEPEAVPHKRLVLERKLHASHQRAALHRQRGSIERHL